MIINHNIGAMNTYRQMNVNQNAASSSMEKLSSGLRINKAADDAAGLSISEKMRGQIRGLDQASRNAQDGISLIQTAEGALSETHDILQRMRELTVQAGNGTNQSEDLEKIQQEISQLSKEMTSIGEKTQFNGKNLLDGTLGATTSNEGASVNGSDDALKILDVTGASIADGYQLSSTDGVSVNEFTLTSADGSLSQTISVTDVTTMNNGDVLDFDKLGVKFQLRDDDKAGVDLSDLSGAGGQFNVDKSGIDIQTGANQNQKLSISVNNMKADQLGSDTIKVSDIDVTQFATSPFDQQLGAIDEAISQVSVERSNLGAFQNRLEHTINNLNTSSENISASESRIRDVDMAKEMMNMTKENIKAQAAQAMLAQANQAPQQVLQLLR
ncbi:flagellin [Bacillus sp. NTK071]|uniref:flagellin N-terminal helical domain-containing protein n=1 Tax=Bacillus sp. NTK071 TaxID=2802175 RepID=UPI001A8F4A6C|nr:flagellin [Bacillus sp. NTK071]MBN8208725.1 flagellin [Bacillus sp. NTK071]